MQVSVAMTTYNGEKYIFEQLLSLKNQIQLPDEVLIFDDCSSDDTVKVIQSFIKENELDNWKLYVNKENVGWKKNFYNAIMHCKGELIFLADQDDYWYDCKIKDMVQQFEDKRILALACNFSAIYIDKNVDKLRETLNNYGSNICEQVILGPSTFETIRPGCTFCFRKELVKDFANGWYENCPHDEMIWLVALLKKGLYIYNKVLMEQKRHEGNSTPSNVKTNSNRYQLAEYRYILSKRVLEKFDFIEEAERNWLKKYIDFQLKRMNAIKNRDFLLIFKLLANLKLYPKSSSWIGDVISIVR